MKDLSAPASADISQAVWRRRSSLHLSRWDERIYNHDNGHHYDRHGVRSSGALRLICLESKSGRKRERERAVVSLQCNKSEFLKACRMSVESE